MAETTGLPQISTTIPQDFIIEALGGPEQPTTLLDRFPDSIYHKSPESHLVRFLYTLLGPVGVGQVRKAYLEARLQLEDLGLELFDLDAFYGNPFAFGRLLEEEYADDPLAPLDAAAQERIRARDAQYRSRALDFLGGVRLGNSPGGMALIARSGLGHDVEIIENYKYLFDYHSDDPKGFRYYGRTTSPQEMIVLPRQTVSQSEQQTITIYGHPTVGTLTLGFNGRGTPNLPFGPAPDANNFQPVEFDAPAKSDWDRTNPANPVMTKLGLQEVLEAHPDIGKGNVRVSGGPGPENPWVVDFIGNLSGRDVPSLTVVGSSLTGGAPGTTVKVTTTRGGLDASDEIVSLAPRDQYHLQQALDRIRAMTIIPTVADASGVRSIQPTNGVYAGSEFIEVVRYVTGNPVVKWPAPDGHFWIEKFQEVEAPRAWGGGRQHYQGFHNVAAVRAYQDRALANATAYENGVIALEHLSQHTGQFHPAQRALYPALTNIDSDLRFTADRATADYPEQPVITGLDRTGTVALVQGMYPVEYAGLSGVPEIRYRDEQFWASSERTAGTDYVEIDLGTIRVVNFLAFETLRKPVDIELRYDYLDQAAPVVVPPDPNAVYLPGRRRFAAVEPIHGVNYPSQVSFSREAGWTYLEFHFGDVNGDPIYTRYLRIALARHVDTISPFLYDLSGKPQPWSVEVRNLRVGRNVSN